MSEKRGSNSRPSAWEADALPTELLSRSGLVQRNYAKEPDSQSVGAALFNPVFASCVVAVVMAIPPLPPVTNRLVGLLLVLSGLLLGVGLLLKVALSVYSWSKGGPQSSLALLLSVNLVGLLASGLLMRWGLRMRRGTGTFRNPNADEIL